MDEGVNRVPVGDETRRAAGELLAIAHFGFDELVRRAQAGNPWARALLERHFGRGLPDAGADGPPAEPPAQVHGGEVVNPLVAEALERGSEEALGQVLADAIEERRYGTGAGAGCGADDEAAEGAEVTAVAPTAAASRAAAPTTKASTGAESSTGGPSISAASSPGEPFTGPESSTDAPGSDTEERPATEASGPPGEAPDDSQTGDEGGDEEPSGAKSTSSTTASADDAAAADDGDDGPPPGENPWAWLSLRLGDLAEGRDLALPDLAGMPGSPALAGLVGGIDLDATDRATALEVLAAFKRVAAWAEAGAARAAGHLESEARPYVNPKTRAGVHVSAEEIAMRLGVSRTEGQKLVTVGTAMRSVFAPTHDALSSGQIDYRKAATIITRLDHVPAQVAIDVQDQVLTDAALTTPANLGRALDHALIAVAPDDAHHRHERARARRHVNHTRSLPDGMGSLYAVLPAQDCVQVDMCLDAIATAAKTDGDSRTVDQLRADALTALANGALTFRTTHPTGDEAGTQESDGAAPAGHGCGECERCTAPTDNDEGRSVTDTDEPTACSAPGDDGSAAHRSGEDLDSHADAVDGMSTADPGPVGEPGRLSEGTGAPESGSPGTGASSAGVDGSGDGQAAPSCGPVACTLGLGAWWTRLPGMRVGDPRVNRTQVSLTLPVSLALSVFAPEPEGAGDDEWRSGETSEVAELAGYGPITREQALALAAGGTWRRILTDPATGTILDVGRTRYKAPADLDTYIRHRDRTCFRPGCSVPARRCQLDHQVPWAHGGLTTAENLGPACTRDHSGKTAGAFAVHQPHPGVFVWITPTGHIYTRHPGGTVTMALPGTRAAKAIHEDLSTPPATAVRRGGAWHGDGPPPY